MRVAVLVFLVAGAAGFGSAPSRSLPAGAERVAGAPRAVALAAETLCIPKAVRLHSVDVGSRLPGGGEPLIVLHGLLGAGNNFQGWATTLASQHEPSRRIVLADLRNHGQSQHAEEMSYIAMAADVIGLLDELGMERAVLCGHSMGAKVAMAAALLFPDRISRLVALDMGPVCYSADDESNWGTIIEVLRAMQAVDLSSLASKSDADRKLRYSVTDPTLRAFILTNLVRKTAGSVGWRWRINLPAIMASMDELAEWDASLGGGKLFEGNALFVAGGKSRYLRTLHLDAIAEQFSAFSITTLRQAAHWIHVDQPEALHTIVHRFLEAPQARLQSKP